MNESNDKQSIADARAQNRRLILWVIAGAYLLYLSFQLGKGLLAGEVAPGVETTIAWGSCIVFGLIGAALLFLAAKKALQSFKRSVRAMEEDEKTTGPSTEETEG